MKNEENRRSQRGKSELGGLQGPIPERRPPAEILRRIPGRHQGNAAGVRSARVR